VLAVGGNRLGQRVVTGTLLRRQVWELAGITFAGHDPLGDQRHRILTLVLKSRRHLHIRVLVVLEGGASRRHKVTV